jgi:hypothetical protein
VSDPVAFVANEGNSSRRQLDQWLTELGPYYVHNSLLRNQTLHRLTTHYWFKQIQDKYDSYMANQTNSNSTVPVNIVNTGTDILH